MTLLFITTLLVGWASYYITLYLSAKASPNQYIDSGYSLALQIAGQYACVKVEADLDSFYNPANGQIHLNKKVAQGHNFVALTIAAHEACHALHDLYLSHLFPSFAHTAKRIGLVSIALGAMSDNPLALDFGYVALLSGIAASLVVILNELWVSYQAREHLQRVLKPADRAYSTSMLAFAAFTYLLPV